MTRARPRFNLPPRGLTDEESAGYLGLGATEFSRRLPELEAAGFPKPDRLTGRRDFKAIEEWWDKRSGLAGASGAEGLAQRLEALRRAS